MTTPPDSHAGETHCEKCEAQGIWRACMCPCHKAAAEKKCSCNSPAPDRLHRNDCPLFEGVAPEKKWLDRTMNQIKDNQELSSKTIYAAPKSNWEEEFDTRFVMPMGDIPIGDGAEIKSFIRSLLEKEKAPARDDLEISREQGYQDGLYKGLKEGAAQLKERILAAIDKMHQEKDTAFLFVGDLAETITKL